MSISQELRDNFPWQPLNDSVLIAITKFSKTAGGIVLPDKEGKTRGTLTQAQVLAVGPGQPTLSVVNTEVAQNDENGVYRIPVPVKPGDFVVYNSIAGFEFGEELRQNVPADLLPEIRELDIMLIRSTDIIAKMKT